MPRFQVTAPLVSVIIPVYNGAAFLPDAIATLEAQQYPALEIIVVDDGSTDATAEVAAQYGGDRLRYFYQRNQGPSAARNHGLAEAQGEVIAFLDVDDQWPAQKLQHQMQVLLDRPEVDIVNGYVQVMQAVEPQADGADQPMRQFEQRFAPVVSFNLGSALFRRSVFDRVGCFDDQQIHSEDVDWFMRARELGIVMVVIEEVTLLYRKHDSNLTRDRNENLRGFLEAVRKSIHRRQHHQEHPGKPLALPQLTYLNAEGELYHKDSQAPAILPPSPDPTVVPPRDA